MDLREYLQDKEAESHDDVQHDTPSSEGQELSDKKCEPNEEENEALVRDEEVTNTSKTPSVRPKEHPHRDGSITSFLDRKRRPTKTPPTANARKKALKGK